MEVDFVDGRDLPPILRRVEPRFGRLGFEPTPQTGVVARGAGSLAGRDVPLPAILDDFG
jgi:hypothetical protein